MSQHIVKINSRHLITLPMAIRNELQLKAGDHLIVRVRDGVIVLVPRPQDAVEQLKGLHREICQGDVDEYIEEERNAWDDPDAADVTR